MDRNSEKTRLMAHLYDLNPFFQDARQFLADLRSQDFCFRGYDCSTQLAIRLIRWSQAINLTPRQKYVLDQVASDAIRRGAAVIESKIRTAGWSIPDYRGDHSDLALAAAGAALQFLVESHDFCRGGTDGTPLPNPSISQYVFSHTRYASRNALEYFIYHKKLKGEQKEPGDCAPSIFRLETRIRQERSLLRGMPDNEKKARRLRKLECMTTSLHQAVSVIRLDGDMENDDGDGRMVSSHKALSMAVWDTHEDDESEPEIVSEQRDFLNMLIQVGNREMPARDLIPYLIEKKSYRGIVGLLRVLLNRDDGGPDSHSDADTLSTLLGSRALSDIRKQILRSNKTDSDALVQIFCVCKSYLRGGASESDVLESVQQTPAWVAG